MILSNAALMQINWTKRYIIQNETKQVVKEEVPDYKNRKWITITSNLIFRCPVKKSSLPFRWHFESFV